MSLSGQLSCISFPRHDEDYLQNVVGSAPYILILGQDCSARYQLLNCLLGERLLPLGSEAGGACGAEGGACRRRKLCFTHGRQTRLSLALPGQYELVHQLAAHCGRWDTVPREDLEIQECEDPAQRLAELEITLHHALLQVRGSCSPSNMVSFGEKSHRSFGNINQLLILWCLYNPVLWIWCTSHDHR